MKTKHFLSLIGILCISLTVNSQTFQLRKTPIKAYDNLNYLGNDGEYYYYSTKFLQITKFKIGNLSQVKDFTMKLDDDIVYCSKFLHQNQLYAVSNKSEDIKETKTKKIRIRFFKLNTENGSVLKKAEFEITDSSKFYYSFKMDTSAGKLFIKRSDSIVKAFTLDMEPTLDFTIGNVREKPNFSSGLSKVFKDLMGNMGLNFTFTFNITENENETFSDSTSMEFYHVSFKKRKDEDIYYFKSIIQGITIASKIKNNKVKSVDFGIDVDKNILDFNYREDKNGQLFLFGKYVVKGKTQSQYGMFSIIYDKDLNEVSSIKYFDLNNFENIGETVPNVKYIGFVFSKLYNADYEFYLEEDNIFAFTYQLRYTNVQDHIYILRVESNGEITVRLIPNRLNMKNKYGFNEKHMALRSGNKIHILFYDHADDINREVSDLQYTNTGIDKKSCVLLTCSYNVVEDDFSKKTLVAVKKELKEVAHLYDPILYFDSTLNQNICLIKGFSKGGNTTCFYELLYVD